VIVQGQFAFMWCVNNTLKDINKQIRNVLDTYKCSFLILEYIIRY